MANIVRTGYGQVEPNHLSAQRNGQIYAQLPAKNNIAMLENGQFVKYSYAEGECNFTGDGEWMLVFNEVKLYEDRQTYKDFAQVAAESADKKIYPRVFKTNIGDIMTTNTLKEAGKGPNTALAQVELNKGDLLKINASGFLEKETAQIATAVAPIWKVAEITTMPDGQAAVKVQRVK